MRGLTVVGIVLALAGGFVLLRGFSFTKDKTVMSVGPLSATVEDRQAVPAWVGGLAVAAGVVLIAVGATKRG